MEGDDPNRRQYGEPNYPGGFVPNYRGQNVADPSGGNLYNTQTMRGGQRGNASQRFRQAHMLGQQTPTSAPMAGTAANPQDLGGFGFTQAQQFQLQGSSLQFQPEYSQVPQRQQQYANYTSQLAPNVPQTGQPQSSYDPMPQYQPRQTAAIEVLSTQFGVPPYYNPGEATSASGPQPISQQYVSANFPQPMQYPSASLERSVEPQPYQQNMAEYNEPGTSVAIEEGAETATSDARHEWYQNELGALNHEISQGKLKESAISLLKLSQWLLGDVVGLGTPTHDKRLQAADSMQGLISDKRKEYGDVYEERLKLWTEFNLLWEALLQRQLDNMEKMLQLNRPPSPPQSVLDKRTLKRMGDELVRLCDGIEQYGLVDYEMGVAEEEIISSESSQRQDHVHYLLGALADT